MDVISVDQPELDQLPLDLCMDADLLKSSLARFLIRLSPRWRSVIVGRSDIVGKPMANLLLQKADGGNATVTVCHSRTDDLAAKTRAADIVVAAAGVPEMIGGDMLSEGVTVIDVGINRVDADTEKGYELVGDVDFDSATEKAAAITPVPGGVGPMTRAMLLYNTVKAAGLQHGVDVPLP